MKIMRASFADAGIRAHERAAEPRWGDAVIVDGDTLVLDADTGAAVLAVASLDATETVTLRRHLVGRNAAFTVGAGRMSGMSHEHATFGFSPRTPLRRRDFCCATQTASRYPATQGEIDRLTTVVAARFADVAPPAHAAQVDKVAGILPDWRLGGRDGLWTSGVVNNTAALEYHRDSNNVPGSWSAMLVLRRFIRGGMLHVPDYGLHVACSDNSLLFFCGSAILHGVTPFRRVTGYEHQAHRLSLVWYAIERMKTCLPPAEEVRRGKASRTAREDAAARL